MALTFNPYDCFLEDLAEGVHNLGADDLKIAASNTLPVATHAGLAEVSEISAGNGYTAGGASITVSSSSQTGGVYTLTTTGNVTYTATGGAIAQFRYLILYNDTSTGKRLIGNYDIGSAIDLIEDQSFICNLEDVDVITLVWAA